MALPCKSRLTFRNRSDIMLSHTAFMGCLPCDCPTWAVFNYVLAGIVKPATLFITYSNAYVVFLDSLQLSHNFNMNCDGYK